MPHPIKMLSEWRPRGADRRTCVQEVIGLLTPDEWARMMWPHGAALMIAEHYDLSYLQVINTLATLPEHLAPMFDDPGGWTMLARCVAIEFGMADMEPPVPSIH